MSGTWASTLNEHVTSKLASANGSAVARALDDVEPALARLLEHAGREVDALARSPAKPSDAPQDEPRAAAHLEHVAPGAVTADEFALELVQSSW